MKFTCLSGNPNSPCNVIQFKSTIIMLDCALDQLSTLSFLPLPLVHSNHFYSLPNWSTTKDINEPQLENELKECSGKIFIDSSPEFCIPELSCINLKHIDVILISNYRSMLALPYITERTEFSGVVYATEPSLNLGKLYMEELVTYIERNPKLKRASAYKEPEIFNQIPLLRFPDCALPDSWETIYSMKEINSCLSKIKAVSFSEKTTLFGSLKWYPVSSGYCIGSCNWIIESAHEKIVYVSNSSTFTTHPRLISTAPLKNADLLILTSLSQTPHVSPNSKINDFCHFIEKCLKSCGNVLVPCFSSGVIYDLFECLIMHLDRSNLGAIPIYFISPIAEHSLAYSNILAEWLSDEKQSRVYMPEEPFPHAQFIRSGRIKHYSSLSEEAFNNDFRTPCIVFTGHPSLRFGDVVHFIELWGSSPNNIILFTEPDFPCLDALAPYQPLAMKTIYCPIDTNFTFIQANKVIRDLKPTNILLPYNYTHEAVAKANNSNIGRNAVDLAIEADGCTLHSYKRGDVIKLPIKCKYERLFIDPTLASEIVPVQLQPGLQIATVTGVLETKDNKFRLCPITKSYQVEFNNQTPTKTLPPSHYLFGKVDVRKLVNLLAQAGITDAVVSPNNGTDRICINIVSKEALIEIEEKGTTIVTEQPNSNMRPILRDIVAQCLYRV